MNKEQIEYCDKCRTFFENKLEQQKQEYEKKIEELEENTCSFRKKAVEVCNQAESEIDNNKLMEEAKETVRKAKLYDEYESKCLERINRWGIY